MTIVWTSGNVLHSDADVLVNTVNCRGVMGAGLAAQFKLLYPTMFRSYYGVCQRGELEPGGIHTFTSMRVTPLPRTKFTVHILNVATKDHWRYPSQYRWVREGLMAIARWMQANPRLTSIAVPPLGCGLGGLKWELVKPLVETYLGNLPGVTVYVYEPK